MIEKTAAPKILSRPGVVGRDGVPPRPASREDVEPRQPASQVAGFVIRGVLGCDETDALGDARQGRQLRDRVGAADDVEVQDLAVLLAQSETLSEEERVEQSPLGRRDDVSEGFEVDLRTTRCVGPDRGVVHALKEHAEVNLCVGTEHVGGAHDYSHLRVAVGGPVQTEVAAQR
jgi:hypothetical protein